MGHEVEKLSGLVPRPILLVNVESIDGVCEKYIDVEDGKDQCKYRINNQKIKSYRRDDRKNNLNVKIVR